MILLRRFLPLLGAVGLFLLYEYLLRHPDQYILIISLVVAWSALMLLGAVGRKGLATYPVLIASVGVFVGSVAVAGLFVDVLWVVHGIDAVSAVWLGMVLWTSFALVEMPATYQPSSLENMFNYANIASVFFIASSAFSTMLLLHWSRWLMFGIVTLLVFLLVLQTFKVNKISLRQGWPLFLTVGIIAAELFLALTFLPLGFYSNGVLLAVWFYLGINISRHTLLDHLTRDVWRRYLFVGVGVVLLTLATAQWL